MLLLRSHPIAGALLLALGATTTAQAATYWNLFNIEGDSTETAQYVTYASFTDMLGDSNRLAVFNPQGFGVGANVVGSGATILAAAPPPIPLPAGIWFLVPGLALLGWTARGRPARYRSPVSSRSPLRLAS